MDNKAVQSTARVDVSAGSSVGVPPTEEADTRPRLSPSRAADFMSCPLLYRFRTIDQLPEPPSPEATRGTVVHTVLERLFDLPAVERTPDRAKAKIGRAHV